MFQGLFVALAAALTLPGSSGQSGPSGAPGPPGHSAALTTTELTWLAAAAPALAFSRAQQLPLSVMVQTQTTAGQSPMGLAVIGDHCVLALAVRGKPEAQARLDRIAPGWRNPAIEAIAAHELGHCWRHLQHTGGTLLSGLIDSNGFSQASDGAADLLKNMWRTRPDNGVADRVGLAWTLQRQPSRYGEVHAWQAGLRADQAVDTGPHDTRVWVRLAEDKAAFKPAGSLFEQAESLWQAGLLEDS